MPQASLRVSAKQVEENRFSMKRRQSRAVRAPRPTWTRLVVPALIIGITISAAPWVIKAEDEDDDDGKRYSGPLSSQPLAISANDRILAVANPDNDTVSFFDLKKNRKFAEVDVQKEPNGVALTPNGKKAFVANTVSGTVSVIKVDGV